MNAIITHSLVVFFFYWLINYSLLLIGFRNWLNSNSYHNPLIAYPFQCSFCFAFWIMLIITFPVFVPVQELFTVPVVVMFIDLLYAKLGGKAQE